MSKRKKRTKKFEITKRPPTPTPRPVILTAIDAQCPKCGALYNTNTPHDCGRATVGGGHGSH